MKASWVWVLFLLFVFWGRDFRNPGSLPTQSTQVKVTLNSWSSCWDSSVCCHPQLVRFLCRSLQGTFMVRFFGVQLVYNQHRQSSSVEVTGNGLCCQASCHLPGWYLRKRVCQQGPGRSKPRDGRCSAQFPWLPLPAEGEPPGSSSGQLKVALLLFP